MAAISVDEPAQNKALIEHLELPYPLLSDRAGDVIRAYGVMVAEGDMAVPATFVVHGGRVTWRHVGEDKADRPGADAVVDEVRRLTAGGPASAAP